MTFTDLWNKLNEEVDTSAGVVLSPRDLHQLLHNTWTTAYKQGYGAGL